MESEVANQTVKDKWDRLGVFASVICVIHCVFYPLVMIVVPLVIESSAEHVTGHSHSHAQSVLSSYNDVHIWLFLLVFASAVMSYFRGYRIHKDIRPFYWMGSGVALVFIGSFFVHDYLGHFAEPIVVLAGSLLMIRGHFFNAKRIHECKLPYCCH